MSFVPEYHYTYKRVIEVMRSEGIRAEYAYYVVGKELGVHFTAIKRRIRNYCDVTDAIKPSDLSEAAILISQLRKCGTRREQEIRSERKKSEQAAARLAKIIAEQEQFLRAREKFVDDYINSCR